MARRIKRLLQVRIRPIRHILHLVQIIVNGALETCTVIVVAEGTIYNCCERLREVFNPVAVCESSPKWPNPARHFGD
jgi:hypothetical protein